MCPRRQCRLHTNKGRRVMQQSHICPCSRPAITATRAALATLAHCMQWAALVGRCPTSAATGKCYATPGAPLSAVSGHKRYNTLYFAIPVIKRQGCSLTTLGKCKHLLSLIRQAGSHAKSCANRDAVRPYWMTPHKDSATFVHFSGEIDQKS